MKMEIKAIEEVETILQDLGIDLSWRKWISKGKNY
jgi:hypothetical protein